MNTTPPDQLCKWPHNFPCLAHRGVLNGELKACNICEPHVENSRKILKIEKISDTAPCPHCNGWGIEPNDEFSPCRNGCPKATEMKQIEQIIDAVIPASVTDVEEELERRGIDWKSSFQKAHDTIDAHIQTQSL